jgi:hypothetical protein
MVRFFVFCLFNQQLIIKQTIELSQKIINESTDFIRVCNVKDIQAATYLKKGEYENAKEVLESLPIDYKTSYAIKVSRI